MRGPATTLRRLLIGAAAPVHAALDAYVETALEGAPPALRPSG